MVIGIVGRGRWGQILERVVKEDPRVERVVVRGRSWEDLLDSRLSGVFVACQPAHHAAVARPFLEAGVPLFIEKPLTLSRADAESLAEMAALRPRVPILVDHLLLFSDLYAPMRERVQQALADGGSASGWITWTGGTRRDDVLPLWDYGSHVIALALDLFGPDLAFVWEWSGNVDYVSSISVEGGPVATRGLNISTGYIDPATARPWELPQRRSVDLRLRDKRGSDVSIHWDDNRKVTYGDAGFSVSEKTPPLTHAVRVFLDAIEGKPDPRLGIDLGVKVVSKLVGLERAANRRS